MSDNEHHQRRRAHLEKVLKAINPPPPPSTPIEGKPDGVAMQEQIMRHIRSDGLHPLPPGVSSSRNAPRRRGG